MLVHAPRSLLTRYPSVGMVFSRFPSSFTQPPPPLRGPGRTSPLGTPCFSAPPETFSSLFLFCPSPVHAFLYFHLFSPTRPFSACSLPLYLNVREFHRFAGGAGTAGFLHVRRVWWQARARVANHKALSKAGMTRKAAQVHRNKPPKGFVSWSEDTFERLVASSRIAVRIADAGSALVLLNVLAREDDTSSRCARCCAINARGRTARCGSSAVRLPSTAPGSHPG